MRGLPSVKPRHLISLAGMVSVTMLMTRDVIDTDVGVTIIMSILAAHGAYETPSPRERKTNGK